MEQDLSNVFFALVHWDGHPLAQAGTLAETRRQHAVPLWHTGITVRVVVSNKQSPGPLNLECVKVNSEWPAGSYLIPLQ